MSDLPPKWSEAKDLDSGDTYFWNTDTNETSWDRPVAPPTAGPAPPPPPPRRREQMATSGDDPEQLLLNQLLLKLEGKVQRLANVCVALALLAAVVLVAVYGAVGL